MGVKMKILIKNAEILTFDNDNRRIKNGYLSLNNGVLEAMDEGEAGIIADEIIDAKNCVVMPGIVNAHTHMPMSLFRGYEDDASLMQWLSAVWKVEDKLTADDVYWLTLHSAIELSECGVTLANDMYFQTEAMIKAIVDSGMRACLTRAVTGDGVEALAKLAECKTIFNEYNGAADGRVRVFIAPHAEYTCSVETLKKCAEAAAELNTVIHVHMSETEDENKGCYQRHGKSPAKLFADTGLFDVPAVAAHCVYVDDADIDLLRSKYVSVAHNPCSNLKLASGIAPVYKMLKAGVNVALGTDGAGSNNNQDIWRDMYVASVLHNVTEMKAGVIGAVNALKMATVNGSKAVCSETGALIIGKRCDIIILDLHKPSMLPNNNTYSLLAYSGERGCVKHSIINGEIVVKNGLCVRIDREKVFAQVRKIAARLL